MKAICPLCKGKGYRWNVSQAVGEAIITLGMSAILDAAFWPASNSAKKPCKLCDGQGVGDAS